MAMTVIGIDPSSRNLACVALLPDGPQFTKLTVPTKAKERAEILGTLFEQAYKVLAEWGSRTLDRTVFIERPIVGPSKHATIVQAQVQGMVLGLANYLSIEAYAVHPSTWKRDVVGNGKSSKEDVRAWLSVHHSLLFELSGGDQDLVDASCIALYGQQVTARGQSILHRPGLAT